MYEFAAFQMQAASMRQVARLLQENA